MAPGELRPPPPTFMSALRDANLLLEKTVRVQHFFRRAKGSFPAWFCLAHPSLAELEMAANRFLSPNELEGLEQLRFEARRRSWLLGRYSTKEALAGFLGRADRTEVEVKSGVFQQPVVVGLATQNAQVSLSHCANLAVAVAFGEEHPLAVDVEEVNPDRVATMQSQMTAAERSMLATLPGEGAVLAALAWTAKEALSKVLKTGLMTPMAVYELERSGWDSGCLVSEFKSFGQYKSIGFLGGPFAFSLVLPKRSELVVPLAEFKRSLDWQA